MGRIFKLVFNLLLFECHNHILIWDNNKAKRHFEERTHYRAGGIGKEIALHFAEKDGCYCYYDSLIMVKT
jgi:hypothetical protein